MPRFWLLLFTPKSLSFVTPFHFDNLIVVKFVEAVCFTSQTQITVHFIHEMWIMPFLQNLNLLFLSWNTSQYPISPVLEQLLGVGVTTCWAFLSVTSTNDFVFGGWPTGLSTQLPSCNKPSAILLENFKRSIWFLLRMETWFA